MAQIDVVLTQSLALKTERVSVCVDSTTDHLSSESSPPTRMCDYGDFLLCVCAHLCQKKFKNELFPTRSGQLFSLTSFLCSQGNSICTKDNWIALLCISLHYRKLGGTSVNSEGHGKSASTI